MGSRERRDALHQHVLEPFSPWAEGLRVTRDIFARLWKPMGASAILSGAGGQGWGKAGPIWELAAGWDRRLPRGSGSLCFAFSLHGTRHCYLVPQAVPDILGFLEHCGAGVKFLHACGQGWAVGPCCPQPPHILGVLFCSPTLESSYFCGVTGIIVLRTG